MSIDIKVPEMGESIVEATVGAWVKNEGDIIEAGETILELETEKVNLEVTAPASGQLENVNISEGEIVNVGTVLGTINPDVIEADNNSEKQPDTVKDDSDNSTTEIENDQQDENSNSEINITPLAKNLADKNNIDINKIKGTGRAGKITVDDINQKLSNDSASTTAQSPAPESKSSGELETRKRITKRRETIAKRLKEAHLNTVMTTTYNEVDMTEIMKIRAKYKESFKEEKGVGLGFMSFFVKSVVQALIDFPNLNSEMGENEIIMKNYYNIGIAVASDEGLVVPVLKNTDEMSFADIEKNIKDLSDKAKNGSLTIEDLQGGTFTISNGGVYGSMLSTPILNPPQSAVLGMHNIVERPVVVDGEIKARPVMFLALSYDHRIIDGKESVSFLKTVKENLEDPRRLFLNL